MAKLKLWLDTRHTNAEGKQHVKISINHKNQSVYIPLNIYIEPSCWDSVNCKVVKHPQRSVLNNILMARLNAAELALYKLGEEGKFRMLNCIELRDAILASIEPEAPQKDVLFKPYYISQAESKHARQTKQLYLQTFNAISKFADRQIEQLTFDDIDVKWLKSFETWLTENGSNSANARAIHFRNIRAVFNAAIDEELISCYPFRKFKIKKEQTRKRNVNLDTVAQIVAPEYPQAMEQLGADAFMLSFGLIGINTIDLYNLKKCDFRCGRIYYKRAKTGRLYDIEVHKDLLPLFDKWRSIGSSEYLFCFADRYADQHNFMQAINKGLARISLKLNLPQIITTYWARHSWATIAASLDIPKETISAALGHSDKSVTNVYIEFDTKKIDVANKKVLDMLYLAIRGEQDKNKHIECPF